MPVILAIRRMDSPGKQIRRPYQENTQLKKGWWSGSSVSVLKLETLSSNPLCGDSLCLLSSPPGANPSLLKVQELNEATV
jgi:hypothetical protein